MRALSVVQGFPELAKRCDKLYDEYTAIGEQRAGGPAAVLRKQNAGRTLASLTKDVDTTIAEAQTHLKSALMQSKHDIRQGSDEDLDALVAQLTTARSAHMHVAAEQAAGAGRTGVWKVGNDHVQDLLDDPRKKLYTLTTADQFTAQLSKKPVAESVKT